MGVYIVLSFPSVRIDTALEMHLLFPQVCLDDQWPRFEGKPSFLIQPITFRRIDPLPREVEVPNNSSQQDTHLGVEKPEYRQLCFELCVVYRPEETHLYPTQFLGPIEKGAKASFTSASKRLSYRGSPAGRNRSGWNWRGSTQSSEEFWTFWRLIPTMACNMAYTCYQQTTLDSIYVSDDITHVAGHSLSVYKTTARCHDSR